MSQPAARRALLVACLASALLCPSALAAFPDGFTHSDLEWSELDTPHFRVIYHEGLADSARVVATIAEGNYERVCESLHSRPPRATPIILADYTSQTREFATQLKHSIWLTGNSLNEGRLDQASWLNLVVHEFAHICTYYKLRQSPLASTWEWVTAPMVPGWFYEGIAESEATRYSQLGYSVLRSAVLEGNLPPLAAIDTQADRTLTDLWLKYAMGQSLVAFMTEKGGKGTVSSLLDAYNERPYFHWAVRHVFHAGYDDIYREWRDYVDKSIRKTYARQLEAHVPIEDYSRTVDTGAQFVRAARVSPDGAKLAFAAVVSSRESVLQLFVSNVDGSDRQLISSDTDLYKSVGFSWSPDSTRIAYARHWSTSDGTVRLGVFVHNIETGEERRLTGDVNAADPAWSPDGSRIAFVLSQEGGRCARIALMDPDGANQRVLTDGPDMPTTACRPTWSPDSHELCFEVVNWGEVGLATMGVEPGGPPFRMLIDDEHGYNRSPSWSPDGTRIAYTGYGWGMAETNVYDLRSGTVTRYTQEAVRSVYEPTWTPDGKELVTVCWGSRGGTVQFLNLSRSFATDKKPRPAADHEPRFRAAKGLAERYPNVDASGWTVSDYDALDSVRVYLTRPNVIADPYGYQPAYRFYAEDPLEKHSFAAEVSYSRQTQAPGWTVEYTNAQHRAELTFRASQGLRGPISLGEDRTLIDTDQLVSAAARYMRNPKDSPLTRELYSFGLGSRTFRVWAASAGATAPRQTTTFAEASYQRFSAQPAHGSTDLRLTGRGSIPGLSASARLYDAEGSYDWTRTCDGTRRRFVAGLRGRSTLFADRLGSGLSGAYLLPSLSYTWRLDDYTWSSSWPVVWLDTIDARLTYEYYQRWGTSLIDRPDGHALKAELIGKGSITRAVPYTVTLGARVTATGGLNVRTWLAFTTDAPSVLGF
jgi:hypothetical protein